MYRLKIPGLSLIYLIGILILDTNSAAAQQAVKQLPVLARHSDLIAHVTVESVTPSWEISPSGRNIITTTRFRTFEKLAGGIGMNNPVTLVSRGGTIGDTTEYVSTSVQFLPGEECILFLQDNPFRITAGPEGKIPVREGIAYTASGPAAFRPLVEAIRDLEIQPASLDRFVSRNFSEPFSVFSNSSKPGLKSSHTAYTNTYYLDGLITDFSGGIDANNDGYFETLTFNIHIHDSIIPGPDTVFFKVNCPTTGQSWLSDNYYIITGADTVVHNFSFDETMFSGYFSGNTDLDFTVQMWDKSMTNLLAEDPLVEGEPVKIGIPIPSEVVITSVSPDKASAGTNTSVTITGSGFGLLQGSGKVEFFYKMGNPDIPATILSWSDTQIVCYVPVGSVYGYPGSTGSGPVKVISASGLISNGYPFRVTFGYGGHKWNSTSTSYYINENLPGVTGEAQAIRDGAETWNALNANFRYIYAGSHSNTTTALNSKNEILWGPLTSSALAESTLWLVSGIIVECDIMFNELLTWTTTPGNPSQSVDIQSIALHELGHWLNLRDLYGNLDATYDASKVMYGKGVYDQGKRILQEDDIAGIYWIYGQLPTYPVSGYVKTSTLEPVQGVVINGLPGNPVTDAFGYYMAQVTSGWSGTLTPSKTSCTFTPATRSITNVTGSLTNQNFTCTGLSSDATLSEIKVNGTAISAFDKNQVAYTYQLPYGTTQPPVVTAKTSHAAASLTVVQATAVPGIATLQVTAENGTSRLTYTVTFTWASASTDAALSDLRVAGSTVAGFSPDLTTYSVSLPYGTITVPAVTATTRSASATKLITPALSLPGSTLITVTAQDGTTKRTYTVNFTLLKNSDATLANLLVSGVSVTGFQKNILGYNLILPYGTTAVPTVTAVPTDPNATMVITPAAVLPGQTTVRVTAENGLSTATYTIDFTVSPASSDAALSDLKVSGATLSGFDPAVTLYNKVLPHGTTTPPPLTFTTRNAGATATLYNATSLPGSSSVVVTAQDRITKMTYSVSFTLAQDNDATLSDLRVSGMTIQGFSASKTDYIVQLPFGTSQVPTVQATQTDPNATVSIIPAASLPGQTRIRVTAEDGITILEYRISFTLEIPSTDATLSSIFVAGQSISGFNPSVTTYEIVLPHGTTEVPNVVGNPANQAASVAVTPAALLPGTTLLVVTAQDRVTKKAYLVNFSVAKSNNAGLSALMVDGNEIPGFDPRVLFYSYAVSAGTVELPVVNAVPADEHASVVLVQAATIPDTATIQVVAEDGITRKNYEVLIRYPMAGTGEMAVGSGMRIFPNPAIGLVTIEWQSEPTGQCQVTIVDPTGRVMLDKYLDNNQFTKSVSLNLSNWDSGVYIVRLTDQSGSRCTRIIRE